MSVSADLIHIGLPDLATEVLAAEFFFFQGVQKRIESVSVSSNTKASTGEV